MDDQIYTVDNSEIRFFLVLAGFLLFLFLVSFVISIKAERSDKSIPTETVSEFFLEMALEAKAVYVYDVRAKTVMFAKNENIRMSLASLTKIMSALVAEDISPLYGTVTISEEALQADGDSGLYKNERWSLKDLIGFSLQTSSNDGMRAIALSLGALSRADATPNEIINDFVGKMNLKAQELGLKNTYFGNETGLDQTEEKGGAYGTARDMTILVEYVLGKYPTFFEATKEATSTFQSLDNHLHFAKNTNSMLAEIPGLMVSKTGFTETAGGNLVFAFDPELGRPIIVTILGSSLDGRFRDARSIVSSVMRYINNY